jgi:hypothetical protein
LNLEWPSIGPGGLSVKSFDDRLLGQGVLQWVKSFVGIGFLWKLDWWSNNWLTNWFSWLINLLIIEGERALIPNLTIEKFRFFDIIAWKREELLVNKSLSAFHSNKFFWMQRMIMHSIYQRNNECACVHVTNENQMKNIAGSI